MRNRQSIRPLRNKVSPSRSSDSLRNEEQRQKQAREILKYGGGGVKKLLFGMTSVLFGQDVASKIATKFRDVDQTEQAYRVTRNITDPPRTSENTRPAVERTVEKIIDNLEIGKIKQSLDGISADVKKSIETLERIESRISPKDLTVGKGEAAQTFRFDPLAPEGRQVTTITASGKSGRFASRKEASMVLSKAAYLGAPQSGPTETIRQLRNPQEAQAIVSLLRESLEQLRQEERARGPRTTEAPTPRTTRRNEEFGRTKLPENYSDFLQDEKQKRQAAKTLRYGGEGFGRKAAFGLTSFLVGEKLAEKAATRFRNKEETQSAFETLRTPRRRLVDGDSPQGVSGESFTAPGDTQTQLMGEKEERERAKREELQEEQTEFNEDIIERLKRIEKKIEECGGGGGSIDGLIAGGLGAAITAAVVTALRSLGPIGITILVAGAAWKTVQDTLKELGRLDAVINDPNSSPEAIANATQEGQTILQTFSGATFAPGAPIITQQPMSEEQQAAAAARWEAVKEEVRKIGESAYSILSNSAMNSSGIPIPLPLDTNPIDRNTESSDQSPQGVQSKPSIESRFPVQSRAPADLQELLTQSLAEAILQNQIDSSMASQQSPAAAPAIVAFQPNINNVVSAPAQQNRPTTISTRNDERSIATYAALIFDHPIEHPGSYKA